MGIRLSYAAWALSSVVALGTDAFAMAQAPPAEMPRRDPQRQSRPEHESASLAEQPPAAPSPSAAPEALAVGLQITIYQFRIPSERIVELTAEALQPAAATP